MSRRYVVAFAAGCLTAALGVWLAADVGAQSGDGAMHVCVAADGVLRAAESPTCQPGQKSLYLFPDVQNLRQDTSNAGQSASLQRKLASLEQQAAKLEQWASRGRFATTVAPFDVVDRNGHTVFSVTNDDAYGTYVRLFNNEGHNAVSLMAFDRGGLIRAASPRGAELVVTASGDKELGLEIHGGDGKSSELGRDKEIGTYRLKFVGTRGLVAGIGQSKLIGAPSLAYVADAGVIKARMYVTQDSHRGRFSISRDGANEIALLSEAQSGGGVLTLYNSGGDEPMVDAGAAAGGFGLVRAGPGAFKPGYGVLGLPGSYISGKPQ